MTNINHTRAADIDNTARQSATVTNDEQRTSPVCRFSVCSVLTALLLSACGSGDIPELHKREIQAAQAAALSAGDVTDTTDSTTTDTTETDNTVSENDPTDSTDTTDTETTTPETPDTTDPATDNTVAEPEAAEPAATTLDGILENYSIVFQDEFNGATIDDSKWNTAYIWGPDYVVNSELQYYVDTLNNPDFGVDPFQFDGERLSITASRTPSGMENQSANQAYHSGVLTTQGKFDFTYGYAEIRAKMPTGKGLWSGFWMLPSVFNDLKPELYIMENRGDNNTSVYHRYNYTDGAGQFQISDLLKSTGAELDGGFHSYGVLWEPGRLRFFLDGEFQHTIEHDNVSRQNMYLILNLAVGGWFPEAPDTSTVFPAQFAIDYVRVYSQD